MPVQGGGFWRTLMFDWLTWFTHMENTKPLALVLFFAAFCGILIYVFTGKQRARRLESYKHIPFQDEAADPADLREASKHERTQH